MKWDGTWAEIKPYRPTATMYNINFVFNLLQFEQTERKQIFIVAINYSLMPETFNMTEATQTIYIPVYIFKFLWRLAITLFFSKSFTRYNVVLFHNIFFSSFGSKNWGHLVINIYSEKWKPFRYGMWYKVITNNRSSDVITLNGLFIHS